MSLHSDIKKTPIEGVNVAFDALKKEVQEGRIQCFFIATQFTENHRARLPEEWAKFNGTSAGFGDAGELIKLIEAQIVKILSSMTPEELLEVVKKRSL